MRHCVGGQRDAAAAAAEGWARLTGKDAQLSLASVRMMRSEADVDSSKAKRELGWQPRPVEESIREAARFWNAAKRPFTSLSRRPSRPPRVATSWWSRNNSRP